jgi:hypothetical protein
MIPARKCGGCTACCKIMPVAEFNKPANTRCQHQRFGKGCSIYHRRPNSCRAWSCAWLVGDDTADLSRPDRSHYVIDMMPDFITLQYEGEPDRKIPVVQVWLDPLHPEAHRDPAFRAYVMRLGERGIMALVRHDSMRGFVLCPPNLASDGLWHEEYSTMTPVEHTAADIAMALEEIARQ